MKKLIMQENLKIYINKTNEIDKMANCEILAIIYTCKWKRIQDLSTSKEVTQLACKTHRHRILLFTLTCKVHPSVVLTGFFSVIKFLKTGHEI